MTLLNIFSKAIPEMNPIVGKIHKIFLSKGSDYWSSFFRFERLTFGWISIPSHTNVSFFLYFFEHMKIFRIFMKLEIDQLFSQLIYGHLVFMIVLKFRRNWIRVQIITILAFFFLYKANDGHLFLKTIITSPLCALTEI